MTLVEIFGPWFFAVGPGPAEFVWFPDVDVLLAWQVGSLMASKWT
jgi:hypothetical protein